MTSSAIAELERPSRVACSERLCEKGVMVFEPIRRGLVNFKHETSKWPGPEPNADVPRTVGGLRGRRKPGAFPGCLCGLVGFAGPGLWQGAGGGDGPPAV